MNPEIASALIGAGSSLLGGLFSKPQSSGQQAQSHVDGIMKAAEKHKINPLTLLGAVSPQSAIQGGMGQAIADAGAFLADGVAKRADWAAQEEQLRIQNQNLQKQLLNATLRPKQAGIYQNAENDSSESSAALSFQTLGDGLDASTSVIPHITTAYQVFSNDGQSTAIPRGPDVDEWISGELIAAHNRAKAREAREDAVRGPDGNFQTEGRFLTPPPSFFSSRVGELLPRYTQPPRKPPISFNPRSFFLMGGRGINPYIKLHTKPQRALK